MVGDLILLQNNLAVDVNAFVDLYVIHLLHVYH
jgi:hypothetical protein